MEWYVVLFIMFACLALLMVIGVPVAFCFLFLNIIFGLVYFGSNGIDQGVLSIYSNLNTFILLPVPLFILMGEVMFHSGIGPVLIRTIDKWIGGIPGRLSLLAVAAGTLFAALTGTSLASVALLGSVLLPEMRKQGYSTEMSVGPILGSGGLAMMIPPSALAVLAAAISEVSVGKTLMAIIVPGLMLGGAMALYIVIRCTLQPSAAANYAITKIPFKEKISDTVKYVLPQSIVIFLVVGVIFLGIATPSEAAATGAMGTFILALCYRRLSWEVIKKSTIGTLSLSGMLFLILCSSGLFSQIIAFSGVSSGMAQFATGLDISPIMIVVAMQIIILVLGAFMDVVSIMMITLPIFMPVVEMLGFDPIWFLVVFLVNIEMAGITPPFGMSLFVLKGIAKDIPMGKIWLASGPFLICDAVVMVLLIIFPDFVLWLPGLVFS
jgi:tripartite ATP-independent transporter DctM subunit